MIKSTTVRYMYVRVLLPKLFKRSVQVAFLF